MIIACIVLSSLALLIAAVNITLFLVDKKREPLRKQALLDYIENMVNGAEENAVESATTFFTEESQKIKLENNAFVTEIIERFEKQEKEIDDLKTGCSPDYQKAFAAAQAVNDFNSGIVSIMNFDPIETMKRKRNNGAREGDQWQE